MAAEEELVAELDGMLWRIEGNYHREGAGPGSRFEGQTLQTVQARALLRRVVEWLAERGRLVPGGDCLVDETWGVKVGGTFAQVAPFRRRVDAETEIESCRANGFTARRSLVRRESRRWPDGTVITTPWVAVQPEPTP